MRARLALVAMVLLPACGSSGADPAVLPPAATGTFSTIYPLIFPRKTRSQCNSCHSLPPNDRSNGNLSLGEDQATAYAALTGTTSKSSKCGQDGAALIVPNHPEESLFYLKLTGNPPCGGHMPLGGDPLSPAQLELVRSWIAAGAEDD